MGVNTLILLPPDVRICDAADVIGILAGLPASKRQLGQGPAYSADVDGVKVENSSVVGLSTITLTGKLIDGEDQHYTTWHWEPDSGKGERLVYPRANVFWIAVARKLVDFFGGSVIYSDCGDHVPDYTAKKPRKANNPNDGKPWQDFQDAKLAVTPLTQSDLQEANQWASYKMEVA